LTKCVILPPCCKQTSKQANKQTFPLRVITLSVFILLLAYLCLAGSVNNEITDEDREAIEWLMVQPQCENISSFDNQIECIGRVQEAIRKIVPDFNCALPGTRPIEPYPFVQSGSGCCYDRARFTEKALRHYGFITRHIALYKTNRYGFLSIFIPGISSHATTEVKTAKGWMGVDSNHPFILLTKDGKPLTYKNFREKETELLKPVAPPGFYDENIIVVYGLYSRHGKFHGRNLPAPEFNFDELKYNLFGG
jgi:hypothetical protein